MQLSYIFIHSWSDSAPRGCCHWEYSTASSHQHFCVKQIVVLTLRHEPTNPTGMVPLKIQHGELSLAFAVRPTDSTPLRCCHLKYSAEYTALWAVITIVWQQSMTLTPLLGKISLDPLGCCRWRYSTANSQVRFGQTNRKAGRQTNSWAVSSDLKKRRLSDPVLF